MEKPPRSPSFRAKLQPAALEMVAARFRALAEPNRLRLLMALEAGERDVTSLATATGLTQANTSRHLNALLAAGILARRKEGLHVLYHIADPSIFVLCDHVCGSLAHRSRREAGLLARRHRSKTAVAA
jgi:DNA-binding transcriptional ArsR family regulator